MIISYASSSSSFVAQTLPSPEVKQQLEETYNTCEKAPAKAVVGVTADGGWGSLCAPGGSGSELSVQVPPGGCSTEVPALDPITKEDFEALLGPANVTTAERVKKELDYVRALVQLAKLAESSAAMADVSAYLGYGLTWSGELLIDERPFLVEMKGDTDDAYSVDSSHPNRRPEVMGWSYSKVIREVRVNEVLLRAAGLEAEGYEGVEELRAFVMVRGSYNMPKDPERAIQEIYARLAQALKN